MGTGQNKIGEAYFEFKGDASGMRAATTEVKREVSAATDHVAVEAERAGAKFGGFAGGLGRHAREIGSVFANIGAAIKGALSALPFIAIIIAIEQLIAKFNEWRASAAETAKTLVGVEKRVLELRDANSGLSDIAQKYKKQRDELLNSEREQLANLAKLGPNFRAQVDAAELRAETQKRLVGLIREENAETAELEKKKKKAEDEERNRKNQILLDDEEIRQEERRRVLDEEAAKKREIAQQEQEDERQLEQLVFERLARELEERKRIEREQFQFQRKIGEFQESLFARSSAFSNALLDGLSVSIENLGATLLRIGEINRR